MGRIIKAFDLKLTTLEFDTHIGPGSVTIFVHRPSTDEILGNITTVDKQWVFNTAPVSKTIYGYEMIEISQKLSKLNMNQ